MDGRKHALSVYPGVWAILVVIVRRWSLVLTCSPFLLVRFRYIRKIPL